MAMKCYYRLYSNIYVYDKTNSILACRVEKNQPSLVKADS